MFNYKLYNSNDNPFEYIQWVEDKLDNLFYTLMHGNEEYQQWLKDKLEEHFND